MKLKSAIKSDGSRTDVAAKDFWIKGQLAFADIRVFNPLARCYLNQSLQSAHKKNENEKKRAYNERIQMVEQGSFTPLVFSCIGGMSKECEKFFSHAAERIAEKRKVTKSLVVRTLKLKLNFSLIKSCLLCIRGTRTMKAGVTPLSELDMKETSFHVKE